MKEVVSQDAMQAQIQAYIDAHADEITAKIQKKIGTAINSAINDAFRTGYSSNGFADDLVIAAVKGRITDFIENGPGVQIDEDKIHNKVQAQVNRALKKIDVTIGGAK